MGAPNPHDVETKSLQAARRCWNGPGVPDPYRRLDRPYVFRRPQRCRKLDSSEQDLVFAGGHLYNHWLRSRDLTMDLLLRLRCG